MNTVCTDRATAASAKCGAPGDHFELRFDSLLAGGRALSFPCDGTGQVDLDRLGERSRSSYFYARGVMGREFARPQVHAGTMQ
jgi:hypothetical protein